MGQYPSKNRRFSPTNPYPARARQYIYREVIFRRGSTSTHGVDLGSTWDPLKSTILGPFLDPLFRGPEGLCQDGVGLMGMMGHMAPFHEGSPPLVTVLTNPSKRGVKTGPKSVILGYPPSGSDPWDLKIGGVGPLEISRSGMGRDPETSENHCF